MAGDDLDHLRPVAVALLRQQAGQLPAFLSQGQGSLPFVCAQWVRGSLSPRGRIPEPLVVQAPVEQESGINT